LESVCEEIGSFIEQYRSNLTDTAYSNERSNPGICTARALRLGVQQWTASAPTKVSLLH
jgi:hypothetical protein